MSDFDTLEYTGTLAVITCWCGIVHAVPRELRNFQQRQHDNGERVTSIFCPIGHEHAPAGKGKAARLQEALDASRDRNAGILAEMDQVTATLRATKGALTKAKKRSANGVCPCCKRTFKQLARHMAGQHPGYVKENA